MAQSATFLFSRFKLSTNLQAVCFTILLTIFPSSTEDHPGCKTTQGLSCVFPFTFKAKTYHGCTRDYSPLGELWCSTRVGADNVHVKGNYGVCDPLCDRGQVVCEAVQVTDSEDNFASGLYKASMSHNNRPVYVNQEKRLFIFYISQEAGWGLGYEDGMQTGGAFYSSGPLDQDIDKNESIIEPWIGAWKDEQISITCDGSSRVPFPDFKKYLLLSATDPCKDDSDLCIIKEQCSENLYLYDELQKLDKTEPEAQTLLDLLRDKVCNREEKGLCCNVCRNEGEKCRDQEQCEAITVKLNRIRSKQTNHSEGIRIYNELQSNLCGENKFCC